VSTAKHYTAPAPVLWQKDNMAWRYGDTAVLHAEDGRFYVVEVVGKSNNRAACRLASSGAIVYVAWERLRVPTTPDVEVANPEGLGGTATPDPINPGHYKANTPYEVWRVCDEWQITDPYVFAALKYLARAGKKGGPEKFKEDLRKAIRYLEHRVGRPD
jgi:hypothetical protein